MVSYNKFGVQTLSCLLVGSEGVPSLMLFVSSVELVGREQRVMEGCVKAANSCRQ